MTCRYHISDSEDTKLWWDWRPKQKSPRCPQHGAAAARRRICANKRGIITRKLKRWKKNSQLETVCPVSLKKKLGRCFWKQNGTTMNDLSTVGIEGSRRFVHSKRDVAQSVIELKGCSTWNLKKTEKTESSQWFTQSFHKSFHQSGQSEDFPWLVSSAVFDSSIPEAAPQVADCCEVLVVGKIQWTHHKRPWCSTVH